MRIYEIYDNENLRSVGVLIYYEHKKSVIIELEDDLDEWSCPLLFSSLVKNKRFTVPADVSFLWVKERIIPSDRQNIGNILNNHKLKEYDEMKFLEISGGKCSQDSLCIKKLDELPEYVIKRQLYNLTELAVLDDFNLLCFFENGKTKKVDLRKLAGKKDIDKILKFENVYKSGKIGVGGYSACFNDSIDIPVRTLYDAGVDIPLTLKDFVSFIQMNVLDTSASCSELECTRQNISYMIKQNQLDPIKEDVKGSLFLKGDIVKKNW